MAGVGKTYWSQQLEETGLHRVSCDELIAQSLIGSTDYSKLCEWLSYPWNENFRSQEKQYSEAEDQIKRKIISSRKSIDIKLISTNSKIRIVISRNSSDLINRSWLIYSKGISNKSKENRMLVHRKDKKPGKT